MFDQMVDSIRESSIKMLLTIEVREAGAAPKREQVAKPTGEGYVPGNGAPVMRELERICLLKCVDRQWMDHIDNMDQLRQGIALRGYGQKDPVVEYRIEGFDMFDQMVDSIRESSVKMLLTIELRAAGSAPKREQVAKPTGEGFVPGNGAPGVKGAPKGQPVRVIKIGRNDPCPCGSGLKWKKCTCAQYHPDGANSGEN